MGYVVAACVLVVLIVVQNRRVDRLRTEHDKLFHGLRAEHALELRSVRAQHADHVNTLLATKSPDLEQVIGLADRMAQRIQAPAQAVIDHSMVQPLPLVGGPQPVSPELDDDFFESKEDLADRLAALERV